MDGVQLYIDTVEMHAGMLAELFVMVARYVNDARAFFGFVEYPLHDVAVQRRPVKAGPEFPQIDDVTDQVKVVAFDAIDKVPELFGLAALGAEMSV